jgi:hypothetical protein
VLFKASLMLFRSSTRACARALWVLLAHWGPGRVPTQTKPTGNPNYLTGRSASHSAIRVVAFDKSRCGQHCPLNGSNGRDLNLPLISAFLAVDGPNLARVGDGGPAAGLVYVSLLAR